ncbi:hypothetical protein LC065_02395 [Halobacillus litoralis]|uniref:hypothetical protein n=1 Tax=Halobacillus litoralis TaxID=45668 RepID=UPI001CFE84B2|nr:hypothetical protein [Halobacillus litoralis]WLR48143.1 hypothetical protein LC065_02395 [Halobacillus litoralis]
MSLATVEKEKKKSAYLDTTFSDSSSMKRFLYHRKPSGELILLNYHLEEKSEDYEDEQLEYKNIDFSGEWVENEGIDKYNSLWLRDYKEVEQTSPRITNNEADGTDSFIPLEEGELFSTELIGNLEVAPSYNGINEDNERRIEEVMQMKFNTYKYYTLIWSLCSLLVGFFATAGITGLLGPFSSTVGLVMSIVGIISAKIDWNEREAADA